MSKLRSKKTNSVLVIAAHPDDEVLGCGGTIASHTRHGDSVHILILAEGLTSRKNSRNRQKDRSALSHLAASARHASRILGVTSLKLHDFPDNRMDRLDLLDIVKVVEESISRLQPHIIYTHHGGDLNIDHRLTHQAVVTACRAQPGFSVKTLAFFEVASSTEWQVPGAGTAFLPNSFRDISSTLDLKLKALKAYNSEMRPWPHARSLKALEHLARWRGASAGLEAAEAFMLGRQIWDGEES